MSIVENRKPGNEEPEPSAPMRISSPLEALALWLCALAVGQGQLASFEATLSAAERDRMCRFGTAALRARYVAGRGALRTLLGDALGIEPKTVAIVRGERGRPRLAHDGAGIDFNVTHTRDVALIALLRQRAPDTRIGVDIEHIDRVVAADALAARYLTAGERARMAGLDTDSRRRCFLRLWTAKEAMSKATGDGLRAPMGKLDVRLDAGPSLLGGPPPYEPAAWQLHDLALAAGFVATAALWTPPPEV